MAFFFWDQDGRNVACRSIRQTKFRLDIARQDYFGTNTDIENMLGDVIAYLESIALYDGHFQVEIHLHDQLQRCSILYWHILHCCKSFQLEMIDLVN